VNGIKELQDIPVLLFKHFKIFRESLSQKGLIKSDKIKDMRNNNEVRGNMGKKLGCMDL
jgi:hypothetical protein